MGWHKKSDMLKSVYDTEDDGQVDNAEQLTDGVNTVTAAQGRSHIDSTVNPHSVSKSDVGLGSVPNLDTTSSVANDHTHSNKVQLDLVTDGDHDVRTDNPHSVDKTDVGLSAVPNIDTTDAVQGKSNLTTQYRLILVNAAGEITETNLIVTNADGHLGIGVSPTTYALQITKSNGNVAFFTDGTTADLGINCASSVTTISPTTGTLVLGRIGQLTEELTAGEAVAAGNICYLKSDGKYWKTDADAEATSKGQLMMATEAISADATGTFARYGQWITTGLTAGAVYYLDTVTAGGITSTPPSGSGDIVRIAGYARSTTVFVFDPNHTYIEI